MDETARPRIEDRLRLAGSLLQAVEETMSPLRRLLAEAEKDLDMFSQDEVTSLRDAELATLRREVQQLRDGMASRAVIERAKGILMQAQGLSEQEAFDLLNGISQREHRKLRDIAADLAGGLMESRRLGAEPPGGTSTPRAGRPHHHSHDLIHHDAADAGAASAGMGLVAVESPGDPDQPARRPRAR